MTMIDKKNMKQIIKKFASQRVLVLGDLMLDKFIWGHVGRISPEAPVPVVEVEKETSYLGGAGNVCRNLESLGANSLPVGAVGTDEEGEWIRSHVDNPKGIFIDKNRPTTAKTRIIAHQQQVVRVDHEKKKSLSLKMEDQILDFIMSEEYDGVLISDYNKGILTKSLMCKVLPYAQKKKIPVFVDPKVENFLYFTPITLVAPNHFEAEKIIHSPCVTDEQVERAGEKIMSRISVKYILLKRSELGMSVFEKGKKPFHIPTLAKQVYDVTGAGDTVIASATLALLSGASLREAATLANTAAGVVVGKIGTATLTQDELLSAL